MNKAINIYKDKTELFDAFTGYILETAEKYIRKNNKFNLVLCGGSSPEPAYKLLSEKIRKSKLDINKFYFFFGDERYVNAESERRNSNMAKRTILDALQADEKNIFLYDTTLSPEGCAADYASRIRLHFSDKEPSFDLILLGLGANAHTASLFPNTDVLKENYPTIKAVKVSSSEYRLTMTAPMINMADEIAFFVYGSEKAEAVRHVLKDQKDFEKYPAQLIRTPGDKTTWFLDAEAASLL